MDTTKYKKLFLTEAGTHIEGIERRLLVLEKEPSNEDVIDGLFRHYHSVKGMSASMGYESIKELAHGCEDLLSGIREDKTSAGAEVISALFNSLDRLKEFIERLNNDKPLDDRKRAVKTKNTSPEIRPLGGVKKKVPGSPLRLPGMVKVDSSIFDELLGTAGELFMILGTFKSLTQNIRSIELKDGVHTLGKAVKKLHGSIFSARMLPIEDLTGGLPRLVRDMTDKSGKAVNLNIKGADISLDRAILEDLASPLVHIIRNAVDHGIETASEREALNKPPEGSITIHAYEKKQRVVILITDDGRGIDTESIRSKLMESGMNTAEAEAMSRDELIMAVSRAGLSTAESVTETSGRGVGMDVVKDVVDAHGGTLHIDSTGGAGTTITIELPRTSSIIRTLMVISGGREILAPISLIEKIVEIEKNPGDIKDLEYEGELIPVVDLAAEMGLTGESPKGAVLIVERDNKGGRAVAAGEKSHVGILVDDFGMEMEAYVKSLSAPLMKIWGISGVTVMGDGRPVFILDIPQVIKRAEPQGNRVI
ncbi:MAG: chemotaxis protein CheA [Thermodesulfobacteriota bacterium]